MSPRLRAIIRKRAGGRCEYCRFPEEFAELRFQIDNVVAQKHGGMDDAANLAFACFRCNTHKGPNLAGIDPVTRKMTRLFNPRLDDWGEHFRWTGAKLTGKTGIGRTTISVLCCNRSDMLLVRRALLEAGVEF